MSHFELSNHQRQYLGLRITRDQWQKIALDEVVSVYFDENKIVKVIISDPRWYIEYDADIDTLDRTIILSRTNRGKEKKLTAASLLKLKGTGVQFTGSWQGGGISVYHLDTKLWLIRSHGEDNKIKSISDVTAWINNFIDNAPAEHLEWLQDKINQRKGRITVREGDVVAFAVSPRQFGFAHVLLNTSTALKTGINPHRFAFMGRNRLLLLPYAFISSSTAIDLTQLLQHPALPAIYIFDRDVIYGNFPVIGNYALTDEEIRLGCKVDVSSTYSTIPYSKTDLTASLLKSQQVK